MRLFQSVLQTLEAHPRVQVLTGRLFPPASSAVIAAAEEVLGAELHPWLKAFFEAHNGICIRWIHRDFEEFDPEVHQRNDAVLPLPYDLYKDYDPQDPTGSIFVPSLEEIFFGDWEAYPAAGKLELNELWEIMYEEEQGDAPFTLGAAHFPRQSDFLNQIRYVDFYLRDSGVAMCLQKGISDPSVFLLEDHFLNFSEQLQLPLSRYLEMVAYHFGDVQARIPAHFAEETPSEYDLTKRLEEVLEGV